MALLLAVKDRDERVNFDRDAGLSRPSKYGTKVVAALSFCWAVLGMPAGKRLALMLGELVAVLRRFGELDIDEDTAALLSSMSAAIIDRRLAAQRRKHALKGRSRTKPGSLLKSQIPVRTWADWDDAVPCFVAQMLGGVGTSYPFKAGEILNLDASDVVITGDSASGAHSDIFHPQLALGGCRRR